MPNKRAKIAFQDDPEISALLGNDQTDAFLSSLKAVFEGKRGYTPVKGRDYFTPEEIAQFKAEILAGATPEKFKDYFTEQEILYVMSEVRKMIVEDLSNGLREEIRPKKGVDYVDGKDADEGRIVTAVLAEVQKTYPRVKEFDPNGIVSDIEAIKADMKALPTLPDILKEIKSKRLIERRDIKGMPLSEQKWHGGGPKITLNGADLSPEYGFSNINLLAGAGVTISTTQDVNNSRVNLTISATGGGSSNIAAQIVTGTQVGDNLEVELTQLSNAYTAILVVYVNGAAADPTRWSIVGATLTLTNAFTSDSIQILYTYA